MNQRKSDILNQARLLFNESGTYTVSTRDIANSLGISQGNLTYHFPHRGSIVEALYRQMNEKLDEIRAQVLTGPPSLTLLYRFTEEQQQVQQRYQFLWLDMARLRGDHPELNAHFATLIETQRQQFPMLIEALGQFGIMIHPVPQKTITLLFEQILILGNFWPHAREVLKDLQAPSILYPEIALAPLLPYLTDQGREEWAAIQGQQSSHSSEIFGGSDS